MPFVLAVAVVTFITWLIIDKALPNALMKTVSVMVIACPCSLGLATPIAIIIGVGVGSKKGILIRNVQSLEVAEKITTIVFDKTGTLTKGKLQVTDIYIPPEVKE